ncbi:MAG: helix-turn-helix transcriptional regulator [Christensenellaceae bacterium]
MDLRSLRKGKGYTIQQVSDGTGLPPTSLKYWEKGERQPAADVLPKLAEFYGITTDKLLGYKAPNLPALEEPEEVFEERRPSLYGGDKLLVADDKVEKALFNECDKLKKSFFKIGYYLTLIDKYHIYQKQGYATITDYAEDKFGIGSSSAYSFMQVYSRTKKWDNPAEMEERFLPFKQSQLVEFARAKFCGIEYHVKPTDTVDDTRAYVSLWNKKEGYVKGDTVKEALAIAEEEKAKKALPQPTAIPDDVPPGQMSIFDEDEESERPFDEPSEEPQEEPENEFEEVGESYSTPGVSMAFVNMAEEPEEKKKEYSAPTIEIEENVAMIKDLLSFKSAFRDCAKEFCKKFDYTIELCGRKQSAWAFAGVLFEHMKAKGLFKC